MSQPLTTRQIFDDLNSARAEAEIVNENVNHYTATMLTAKHEFEIAKGNLERAEADAFIEAKDDGKTDAHAKRLALRKTQVEIEIMRDKRKAYEDAKGNKETAERQSSMWKAIIEGYASTSYSLNRELKVFERTPV